MIRTALTAAACVLALAGTASASSSPVTPAWTLPAWWQPDALQPQAATPDPAPEVTGDPGPTDPPPPAAMCPDRPADQQPIAACPTDPNSPTGARCNYGTGNAADPCPHADADWIIVRCNTDGGAYWHVARDATPGVNDATVECAPDGFTVIDDGGLPVGDPPPPPPVSDCPNVPSSTDPIAACPFDPDTYWQWPGDDADAPLWTHCNYNSGDAAVPCPHSFTDDPAYYVRCNSDGVVWSVSQEADTVTVGSDDDYAWQACDGPYTSLALKR